MRCTNFLLWHIHIFVERPLSPFRIKNWKYLISVLIVQLLNTWNEDTTLWYKNTICFFFFFLFFFFTHNVRMGRVRADDGAVFLWNLSAFSLRSPLSKFFPGLHNFQDTNPIAMAKPSAYVPRVGTPPLWHATHATQMVRMLRNTCVLLGSKWTSWYVTHGTHVVLLLECRPLYHRKQAYILSSNPWNFHGMSKESSCRYPVWLFNYM